MSAQPPETPGSDDAAGAPATSPGLPGWAPLWFAVVGGQAAWAIALLVSYPTVQIACQMQLPVLVHLVRWVAAPVALAAAVVGYRCWRRVQAADTRGIETQAQRATLMAFGGMLLSSAGLILLFVESLATWVIDPCL